MEERIYKAQTRYLFHAHIKIKISAFYDDSFFDGLFSILEDVDKKYNSYQPDSYIDRINKAAGSFVEVDSETVNILRQVLELSDFFAGAYDITVMPLIRLWGFYRSEHSRIPTEKEIAENRKLVSYRNIEIEGNKVRIADGQELITGSFIKAYAVDRLVGYMRQVGVNDAIINAGGSTICAINDNVHPAWQVIVREPKEENVLFNVDIADQAYSTSSQSKTFLEINGKEYGHILNAKTGMPSTNKQVGVISDNCMVGDIISTGLYCLSGEDFLQKMEQLSSRYKVEGFLLDEDDRIFGTKRFVNKKNS